ncbi:MAG: hypothetical protein LBK62_12320 [Treponema sp.]|jgi:hypothetical protein|nr:hypothetical protein [Treponema sp.]
MNKPINTENRRKIYPEGASLYFSVPPRIGNRSDALELLDDLIKADYVEKMDIALKALRDAIEREVI